MIDDRRILEVVDGPLVFRAVQVAHDLGLFDRLQEGPRRVADLGAALVLRPRPLEALLLAGATLGLVRREGDVVELTAAARTFLVSTSPSYMGSLFGQERAASGRTGGEIYGYESLRRAVLDDEPQAYARHDWDRTIRADAARAREFMTWMAAKNLACAPVWPARIDLDGCRRLLDVGAGPGCHAFAALRAHADLEAVLFDVATVAAVARDRVAAAGLDERVAVVAGDFWSDELPLGCDVHFFGDIFHDWPLARGLELARKSHGALPPGGRILVHEILTWDDQTGPFLAAASSLSMLLWTRGAQYSARQIGSVLEAAGFEQIESVPTVGAWGVVCGRKPPG